MNIPKIIAFYFPQFHEIQENNKWWGQGFTDWKLVKEATALFEGHNQPREPFDSDYYNPCEIEVLKKQSLLAKNYGIGGFMFYHYWFDGKLLLEKPLEVFLDNSDIDIEFCITWANESWTRSWVGKPEVILQKQLHTNDQSMWAKHFEYLLPFFKDSRYIKINKKPVFLIYQPFLINNSEEMFAFWNELAKMNGLDGIYLIAIKNHDFKSFDFLISYDAIMKFQPREAYSNKYFQEQNISARFQLLRQLPNVIQTYLSKFSQLISKYKVFDSTLLWNIILKRAYQKEYQDYNLKVFESIYFEWDNTPRYKNKAKIFTSLNTLEMKINFKKIMDLAIKNESPFIFFNAWNEWSESAYLEPDKKNGFAKLEIIKQVISEFE